MSSRTFDDAKRIALSFPLPADTHLASVVLYGSVARGWATPQSDIDVAIVCERTGNASGTVLHEAEHKRETQLLLSDGTHIEFSLYHVHEIEGLLERQHALSNCPDALSAAQVRLLDDLHQGRALVNEAWLAGLMSRAIPKLWAGSAAHHHSVTCHTLYRDVLGFLAVNEVAAAASTGRRLAEAAYDWLCAINGDPCMRGKWRYRRHSANKNSAASERVCMSHLIALQSPNYEPEIASPGSLVADCIRLFQYVADLYAVIQNSARISLPAWTTSTMEKVFHSGNMRSPHYYLMSRNDAFIMLRGGLPQYELEPDIAHAWVLLSIATPTYPLYQVLRDVGFDKRRIKDICDQFAINEVTLQIS